jgi:predicted DNA-binding protein with PD1-like motif
MNLFQTIAIVWFASFVFRQPESKIYTLRLVENDDLKIELLKFVKENKLRAVHVVTCVGALYLANIRLPPEGKAKRAPQFYKTNVIEDDKVYEVLSLVGTIEYDQVAKSANGYLHIAVLTGNLMLVGGELMKENIVYKTMEITLLENRNSAFESVFEIIPECLELDVMWKYGGNRVVIEYHRLQQKLRMKYEELCHFLFEGWW